MEKMNTLPNTGGPMNRRAFLRLSGLLGLGVASGGIVPAAAEAVKFNGKLYKISKTRLAMGTFVSMTLIHPSRDEAQAAMGLAFEEIDRLTRTMSRFDDTTAVAQLNKEGRLSDVPPEVAQVVARGLGYYRLSRGNFDISVKPVVDLFRETFDSGKDTLPSESEVDKALVLVGSDMIELDGRTLRFRKPGMGITLDGIAKGYIVDRASQILTKHNIRNHLINAGGDIRTTGLSRGKRPWTIAIQDPKKQKKYPDIIKMTDGAVATSGNYEVYFDREKMFHHIVNPDTGRSPEASTSVSVIADTTMDADALSTSVFVMNPVRGTRFINTLPRCECLVIARNGEKFTSAGWKSAAT